MGFNAYPTVPELLAAAKAFLRVTNDSRQVLSQSGKDHERKQFREWQTEWHAAKERLTNAANYSEIFRPLTPEEAQRAYDEAESVPLSQKRIQEIVDFATRKSPIEALREIASEEMLDPYALIRFMRETARKALSYTDRATEKVGAFTAYPPHDPDADPCRCRDCCEADWQRQQDDAASEPRDYRTVIDKAAMRRRE